MHGYKGGKNSYEAMTELILEFYREDGDSEPLRNFDIYLPN